MKRWIPATCVALLCGAAFGQTCEKSQSCEEKASAVSLVKGESDCASACDAPRSNWLSVAYHRANAAHRGTLSRVSGEGSCDDAKSCTEGAKASVIAASQTKAGGSHCASGQGVAAAIVAADGSGESCDKAGCSEAGVALIAANYQVDQKAEKKGACCEHGGQGECCEDSGVHVTTASHTSDKAINKTCPMTGKPVSETALVEYKGKTLGFCGAGCASYFENADAEKQAKVYSTILASQPTDLKPSAEAKAVKSDPYTLDICPVSGGKLGSMGDPITKVVNGREVKFCCAGCPEQYEADPAKFNAKIDKLIAKQQMAYYPLKTCLVAGTPLEVDGKDVGKNVVINNRLARVCCDNCAAKLRANPAEYFAKLDKAVIAKQAEHYPLENCLVMESSELGAMGEPIQIVSGNRLVKFCCKGCVGKFQKDPAAFIGKLDKAWMAKYPEHFKMAQVENAGG